MFDQLWKETLGMTYTLICTADSRGNKAVKMAREASDNLKATKDFPAIYPKMLAAMNEMSKALSSLRETWKILNTLVDWLDDNDPVLSFQKVINEGMEVNGNIAKNVLDITGIMNSVSCS